MQKKIKKITFQVGTDIIGQPIFRTHIISKSKDLKDKNKTIVKGFNHR